MTQDMNKRELLCEINEAMIVFENPDYDSAIIGYTTDDRVVYDYELMVISLMKEDEMSEEEAADFISYNTIRALPYAGSAGPIILFRLPET